jgi:hypothetical protein
MSTSRFSVSEIVRLIGTAVLVNVLFATALFFGASVDDFRGISKNAVDRFVDYFYFGITTFTTTGYGDIVPTSRRAKLLTSLYMILVFAGALSFLFDF